MRIVFILEAFPALSETFILNQITGLIDLGHEVEIFARYQPKDKTVHSDVCKYNLIQKIQRPIYKPVSKIRRWIKIILLVLIRTDVKDALKILISLNIDQIYKIIPFLGKRLDVIYCHFGPTANEYLFLKDIFKIPYVTKFYGYDVSSYIKQQGKDVYKELFKKGDLFLSIGNNMKDRLIQLGCPKDKIIIHHMGIDVEKFKFNSQRLHHNGKINILTIARLVEKKGLWYSIEAVARTIKKYPNIEYKIIGDGPCKNELQRYISNLGVNGRIRLVGKKNSLEVSAFMREADIFLLSSITATDGDMEGIPVSLMEAQAVGLPTLSTYHSGIPEVVKDGKSGFLVPEKNIEALSEKLIHLIEHPEKWPKLGRNGRSLVEEKFNIVQLNKKLEEIYISLIKRKRAYAI